jgi:hypothetical protein
MEGEAPGAPQSNVSWRQRQERRQEKHEEPQTQLMKILGSHEVDEARWAQTSRREVRNST